LEKNFLVIPSDLFSSSDSVEDDISSDSSVWKLITKLVSEADNRLGTNMLPEDAIKVLKSDPFFDGIDFEKMMYREDVPFVPKLKNDFDTSYFGNSITTEDVDFMQYSTLKDLVQIPPELMSEELMEAIKKKDMKKCNKTKMI